MGKPDKLQLSRADLLRILTTLALTLIIRYPAHMQVRGRICRVDDWWSATCCPGAQRRYSCCKFELRFVRCRQSFLLVLMSWSAQRENTRSAFLSIGDMSNLGVFFMAEIEQEGNKIHIHWGSGQVSKRWYFLNICYPIIRAYPESVFRKGFAKLGFGFSLSLASVRSEADPGQTSREPFPPTIESILELCPRYVRRTRYSIWQF